MVLSVSHTRYRKLRAHFNPVQCCAYRSRTQELVTAGADGLVLLWSPAAPPSASRASYISLPSGAATGGEGAVSWSGGTAAGQRKRRFAECDEDEDMWSSDDEGAAGGEGGGGGRGVSGGEGREDGRFVPPILMQRPRQQRRPPNR